MFHVWYLNRWVIAFSLFAFFTRLHVVISPHHLSCFHGSLALHSIVWAFYRPGIYTRIRPKGSVSRGKLHLTHPEGLHSLFPIPPVAFLALLSIRSSGIPSSQYTQGTQRHTHVPMHPRLHTGITTSTFHASCFRTWK